MKSIGIDIGTTSICVVLTDNETGRLMESITVPNKASVGQEGSKDFERLQIPEIIIDTIKQIGFLMWEDVGEIGVTGQMHGMLYLDAQGAAVSPLYTWQDGRGDLPYEEGLTYAEYLSKETGYHCATGYGLVTHFYNMKNGLVPENAVSLCTIGDYVSASLAGVKKPIMHDTNACSMGFYDIARGFDEAALDKIGVNTSILPDVTNKVSIIGKTAYGSRVKTAVGDNQASVYGAIGMADGIVLNVGTGSQISVISQSNQFTGINTEIRPYFRDKILIVGSALMGGDAYAALERFFAKAAEMFGQAQLSEKEIYAIMEAWLRHNPAHENGLTVDTRFKGTRRQPGMRGGIYGMDSVNFTPEALIHGFLEGIVDELWEMYCEMPRVGEAARLVGSGNGIRKNEYLRGLIEKRFGMPLFVSTYEEEAAYGAAMLEAWGGNYSDF